MKKFMTFVCIFAIFGFANAQFQGGLTSEVPNLRVNAMGGVYSLLETSNYADFPQRLLTGQEGAWIGTNRADSWGLVRFNLNNFLALPMPMAWQISAEQNTMVTIDEVFDHVGMDSWAYYLPYTQMGAAYEATNRINSTFAIGLQSNIIAGLGIKLYSNSNAYDETNGDDNNEDSWEHDFWGLETTWGGTMILDDNHFIDASLDLDFWSWNGSYEINDVDQYEEGYSNCDGIWNFGINGRYYVTGNKVDYAPYMKFNYFSFSSSIDEDISLPMDPADIQSNEYNGSLFNFTLGSGVHYKPAKGVQVYNEFEFRYQSASQEIKDVGGTWSENEYQSRMTLLPTYRMGVEIVKEIDPKIWWGFNSVQLWGGFNKTFDNLWTGNDWDDEETDNNDYEEEYTQETFEVVNVTTGAALQNGNFKVEFYTTVNNLYFNDNALNNVYLGLVYMFSE
ncbi:MAG: hypothetical protein JXN63_08025 [Candidatus Delongbacteria bacterium]|nr:hypothetical protein [Candidatus Delongbacteria bacterium]